MFHISERPETFDDFLGSGSVVKSLKKQLEDEGRPHVYLFHGPAGCGKTTLARIMANSLGASGFGILEINISDQTGVEGARQIINELAVGPIEGDCKVYILDELDKASDSWQSAMKKPLEDTPSHTYFMMCTENPTKIKKAIRTRAEEYKINPLSDDDLLYLLKKVSRKYKFEVSRRVLNAILARSNGSGREALTVLEQIRDLDEEDALDVIAVGVEDPEVINVCREIWKEDLSWKEFAKVLNAVRAEPETIRRAILGYAAAILSRSGDTRAFEIIDIFRDNIYDSGKPGLLAMCFDFWTHF
jgi:DNA polymerase III gamma/tau subunit